MYALYVTSLNFFLGASESDRESTLATNSCAGSVESSNQSANQHEGSLIFLSRVSGIT